MNTYRVLAIVALASSSLCACGGGGGSSSPAVAVPPPVGNQSVGGLWRGQFTTAAGVSVAGIGLVSEDGRFFTAQRRIFFDILACEVLKICRHWIPLSFRNQTRLPSKRRSRRTVQMRSLIQRLRWNKFQKLPQLLPLPRRPNLLRNYLK